MSAPLITIVIATHNAGATLPACLLSLQAQRFDNFSVVLQDAVSSDESECIFQKFSEIMPFFSWKSESDSGIYDAWNKALDRVQGEWVLFLGADDCLYDENSLSAAAEILTTLPDTIDYFATSLVLVLPTGEEVEKWCPLAEPLASLPSCMSLPHPALFHRARLFKQQRFNTSFRIAGDYDFLCRTLTKDNVRCSSLLSSRMRVGGISGSLDTMLQSELECWRVSRQYFPKLIPIKLIARLCRSVLYKVIASVAGEKSGYLFADIVRKVQGKPPLWASVYKQQHFAQQKFHSASAAPYVSLIVATVGRREALAELLLSLRKQTYKNFEILLVDQNAPGFLTDILHEYSDLPIVHISLLEHGASMARNVGLRKAQGDIIAFPDDDCLYEPKTLEKIVAVFAAYPEYDGLLAIWKGVTQLSDPLNDAMLCPTKLNSYTVMRKSETYVQFLRRNCMENVFFDEGIGPGAAPYFGSAEDTDFLLQIMAKGHVLGRTSFVCIFHPTVPYGAPHLCTKAHSYGMTRMYMLKKFHYSIIFQLANVIFPLAILPFEFLKHRKQALKYRWSMFCGRWHGFWHIKNT